MSRRRRSKVAVFLASGHTRAEAMEQFELAIAIDPTVISFAAFGWADRWARTSSGLRVPKMSRKSRLWEAPCSELKLQASS